MSLGFYKAIFSSFWSAAVVPCHVGMGMIPTQLLLIETGFSSNNNVQSIKGTSDIDINNYEK